MALGRGLGEILPEVGEAYEKDIAGLSGLELEEKGYRVVSLPLESISPNPYQPRKHFDEEALRELSESIKAHGLLQPIVVIEAGEGYTLVAGERRLRAHKLAGLDKIEAVIADIDLSEAKMRELALIENIQRENLNAMELANSYAELIEVHGITHEELAGLVHKSRSHITNTMRLLSLSAYAQAKIREGKISQGHAKVLVGLSDAEQKVIIDSVIGQKLSVRDAEALAKRYKMRKNPKNVKKRVPDLLDPFKEKLSKALPFRHTYKADRIEIVFESTREIEAFLDILENRR